MNILSRIVALPAVLLSRLPVIGPWVKAASTSVGQKVVMALTGLALSGFLVAHLGGNLLLFAGEEKFNDYADALHAQGALLKVAEVGLLGLFLLHMGLAVSTNAMNRQARSADYAVKETKQGVFVLPGGGASSWMVVTGILVALFLVNHLVDLRFKMNPLVDYPEVADGERMNEFQAVRAVLTNAPSAGVYLVGLIALGIHLSHGIRSAFQSLGLSHKRWDDLVSVASKLFGWVIAVGFISLIMWAFAT